MTLLAKKFILTVQSLPILLNKSDQIIDIENETKMDAGFWPKNVNENSAAAKLRKQKELFT